MFATARMLLLAAAIAAVQGSEEVYTITLQGTHCDDVAPEACGFRFTTAKNLKRYGAHFPAEIYTRGCYWIPTHVRLKRTGVRPTAFLSVVRFSYRFTL
jgi:hypothetical protein